MVFAYFDTCVWLSALLSRDVNHDKAIELFRQVRAGQYVVIVSHHILNEIIDFLKKQAAIRTKDEQRAVELTKRKYREFSNTLLRMPNVRIKNPHTPTHDILRPSFSLLFKYLKGILHLDKCPICQRDFEYVEPDTIFEGDALHVLLAWNLNCDVFITFDKDFKNLEKEPRLSPMKIKVIS